MKPFTVAGDFSTTTSGLRFGCGVQLGDHGRRIVGAGMETDDEGFRIARLVRWAAIA